jgi:Uncharacterized protein, putative amidase
MQATDIHGRDSHRIREAAFAVVPLGSFEYHGPHSPFGTDLILSESFAREIDERLGGVLFPAVPYTACPGKTAKYPGTISIRPSVILEYLIDVAEGILNTGLRRLVFLNAHDGNMGVSRTAAEYLTGKYTDARFLLINWWQMIEIHRAEELGLKGTKGRGHGGPYEMSAVKAFRPDLVHVHPEDAEFPDPKPLSELPYVTVDGTPPAWDGYTGMIRQISLETGKEIVRRAARGMNELIANWLRQTEAEKRSGEK